jgi:tripartite-type tricarboxylate transporter receptor subunit TctC
MTMGARWRVGLLSMLAAISLDAGLAVRATAADDGAIAAFYHSTRLTIIVGFGAGGGYDLSARVLARHLPKHIPGNPTVIVVNKTGAGSIIATNALYNTERKDGSVIGAVPPTVIMEQALGEHVDFDGVKFNWLGSSSSDFFACAVRTDTGINNLQDTIEKPVAFATQEPGSQSYAVPALLKTGFQLGPTFKVVPGYTSIPAQFLAVEKKEVSGVCQSYSSVLMASWSRYFEPPNPLMKIIVSLAAEQKSDKFLDGVPTALSLAKTDQARGMFQAIELLGRTSISYAAPPEVPRDRVEALRAALAATLRDPDFLADAAKAGLVTTPNDGPAVAQTTAMILALKPDVLNELRPVLGSR